MNDDGLHSMGRDRERAFFRFDPVELVEDVYNAVDDYISDGLDELERSLLAECAAGGSHLSESEMHARIAKGCDGLVTKLRSVFDCNVDLFEVYVLRNIFVVPRDLDVGPSLPAEPGAVAASAAPALTAATTSSTTGAASSSSSSSSSSSTSSSSSSTSSSSSSSPASAAPVSAADVDALKRRVEELETRIEEARRTRRALKHVERVYKKQSPLAEEAARAIATAANAFSAAADGGKASVSDMVNKADRLRALCDRLAEAGAGEPSTSTSFRESLGRGRRSLVADPRRASLGTYGSLRTQYAADAATAGEPSLRSVSEAARLAGVLPVGR